jgi:hypothetical protein
MDKFKQIEVKLTMRSVIYFLVLLSNTTICFFAIAEAYNYQVLPVVSIYLLYVIMVLMSINLIKVENQCNL